jgi:hypothetical protein
LELDGCNAITDAGIKNLQRLDNLQHLDISNCPKLTDFCTKYLPENLKSLKMENLNITNKVADFSQNLKLMNHIKALMDLPKHLTSLSLARCKNITNHCLPYMPMYLNTLDLTETPNISKDGFDPTDKNYIQLIIYRLKKRTSK